MFIEEDIIYEKGDFWVLRDRQQKAYTVLENMASKSITRTSFAMNDDGFSIARAYCDHLAKASMKKLDKHPFYNRTNFPRLVWARQDSNWHIYANAQGQCAAIPVRKYASASAYGDLTHVRNIKREQATRRFV